MSKGAIEQFMASVRADLADVSGGPARKALEYFEEFISEALEAGRSEEEILSRLGTVEEIVAQVRAEASLNGAEANPGPFSLIRARRSVLRGIADSAGRVSLVMVSSVPFIVACAFYLTSGGLILGSLAWAGLMSYGIAGMTAPYVREMISVSGATILSLAVLAALALAMWRAANAMSRITVRVLRKGLRKGLGPEAAPGPGARRPAKAGRTYLIFGLAAVLGACLVVSSSLPFALFSLWNSERPADLVPGAWTFPSRSVRNIEVATLNSSIVVRPSRATSIRVASEEPPWLEGAPALINGKLVYRETSRGMFPYMAFLARHPGTTSLTIEVPRGLRVDTLIARTIGGSISIELPARSIRAATGTGLLRYSADGRVRLEVKAPVGQILVHGAPVESGSYESGPSDGSTVELRSTEGRVEIQ